MVFYLTTSASTFPRFQINVIGSKITYIYLASKDRLFLNSKQKAFNSFMKLLNTHMKVNQGRPKGGCRGASPPFPFLKGGEVPFDKVYFINVYTWTEPYHRSIVNHLLSTICSEIVTTAYRFLISAL